MKLCILNERRSIEKENQHYDTKQRAKTTCWGNIYASKISCYKVVTYVPFGCQNSDINLIFGGFCGYSLGKYKCALNKPPSLQQTANKTTKWALHKYRGGYIVHETAEPTPLFSTIKKNIFCEKLTKKCRPVQPPSIPICKGFHRL